MSESDTRAKLREALAEQVEIMRLMQDDAHHRRDQAIESANAADRALEKAEARLSEHDAK